MCLNIAQKNNHQCVANRYQQDCAICMEDMHTSRIAPVALRCGHAMHSKCYNNYLRTQIACPLCKKSIIDPKLFEASMDMQLASMQMPAEYKDTKMLMLCNDCLTRSLCPFHIMGGKCKQCNSYNTTRIDDEAELRKFEA